MLARRKTISALILVVLFVAACGGQSTPAVARVAPTNTPAVPLDPVVRVEAGGFSFHPPTGYKMESYGAMVMVAPTDAVPEYGPTLILTGGTYTGGEAEGMTLEAGYAEAKKNLEAGGMLVSEPVPVTMGGQPALSGSLSGTKNSTAMAGRVVVCLPAQGQTLVLMAASPQSAWLGGFAAVVDAVLATVEFFAPTAP